MPPAGNPILGARVPAHRQDEYIGATQSKNETKMNGINLWQATYAVLAKVIKWSVLVALFCAVVIMMVSVIDVIGAKFFDRGLPGSTAFVEELNLVLVFMAVAYVQIERGNIGIAFLNRYLPTGLNHAIALAGHVLGILVCGFFSWRTLILVQHMIATGDIKNAAAIEFPLWPFALVNFYGYALLTIAFILCLGRGIIAGSEK
jgi:TRAP-type C4-dicarboxylate transport system permease small subunit